MCASGGGGRRSAAAERAISLVVVVVAAAVVVAQLLSESCDPPQTHMVLQQTFARGLRGRAPNRFWIRQDIDFGYF